MTSSIDTRISPFRPARRACTLCLSALFVLPALGCALQPGDEADPFRQALPSSESVALSGPESSARAAGARSQSVEAPGVGELAAGDGAGSAAYAEWYAFTRATRDGVNHITGGVLGSLWIVARTRPTTLGEAQATWGPYTDALEPASWQLRIERAGEGEYEYVLEGRPKSKTSEEDWVTVLRGTGFGRERAEHGDGEFSIDLDALRALDPVEHADDSGHVRIEHDLPASASRELGALPRSIRATLEASDSDARVVIDSRAEEDGSGRLDVEAYVDAKGSATTAFEDIAIVSRWQPDGAGRADVALEGGDVPAELGTVSAVECWGTDFARVYYADSVEFAPAEGDPTACVLGDP